MGVYTSMEVITIPAKYHLKSRDEIAKYLAEWKRVQSKGPSRPRPEFISNYFLTSGMNRPIFI
jgi:hypothetical protein